jgi:hypothetical protein
MKATIFIYKILNCIVKYWGNITMGIINADLASCYLIVGYALVSF